MSVNELRALTQRFADAFDERELKPAIEMLAEDVEVFEYLPSCWRSRPTTFQLRGLADVFSQLLSQNRGLGSNFANLRWRSVAVCEGSCRKN